MRQKTRNPYANKTDVHLELLGINQPDLLTPEEILFFRTGDKADLQTKEEVARDLGLNNAKIVGKAKFPDLKDVTPPKKQKKKAG